MDKSGLILSLEKLFSVRNRLFLTSKSCPFNRRYFIYSYNIMGLGSRSVFPPLLASSDDAQSAQSELWVFWDFFVRKMQQNKRKNSTPTGSNERLTTHSRVNYLLVIHSRRDKLREQL